MATTKLSPAANLLRRSRVFALPPSLKPPPLPATSNPIASSDTATLPYPIRAAIETPSSSLARGDWGLKRPLPSKSTTKKSSNPVVRIKDIDTYEHVTDFESAADHTLTLQKWQELHLPISTTKSTGISARLGGGRHVSVFDSTHDNTQDSHGVERDTAQRYRFKGPWLAGQTEIEFQNYLKSVRRQKPEFLKRLRELIVRRRQAESKRRMMDEGIGPGDNDTTATTAAELSEAEFESTLRSLRADPRAFGPVIYEFFDLATPPRIPNDRVRMQNWDPSPSNLSALQYSDFGPPQTHPSAGLSYLRTAAHIDNHSIAGPQQESKPVPARFLKPKGRGWNPSKSLAGVAGIVTDELNEGAFRDIDPMRAITQLDPDIPGGTEYWVKPVRATVTSEGRVSLSVTKVSPTTKAIHGVEEDKVKALPDYVRAPDRSVPRLDSARSNMLGRSHR